jgi:hypothetical protein
MSLRHLDWKVIVLTLAACYGVPAVVIGGVLVATGHDTIPLNAEQVLVGVLAMVSFLVPPVAGGYVAARFARERPRLHVFVVGALGALLSLLAFRSSPRAMIAYALGSLLLASFGGFLQMQGKRRDGD